MWISTEVLIYKVFIFNQPCHQMYRYACLFSSEIFKLGFFCYYIFFSSLMFFKKLNTFQCLICQQINEIDWTCQQPLAIKLPLKLRYLMWIHSLPLFSNIIASLCFVSKGTEISWFEMNGANIFWIFFIDEIGFFSVLLYHKTARQVSSCASSVIPVLWQVIHSQLQPFLYACSISTEKSLQLRSGN